MEISNNYLNTAKTLMNMAGIVSTADKDTMSNTAWEKFQADVDKMVFPPPGSEADKESGTIKAAIKMTVKNSLRNQTTTENGENANKTADNLAEQLARMTEKFGSSSYGRKVLSFSFPDPSSGGSVDFTIDQGANTMVSNYGKSTIQSYLNLKDADTVYAKPIQAALSTDPPDYAKVAALVMQLLSDTTQIGFDAATLGGIAGTVASVGAAAPGTVPVVVGAQVSKGLLLGALKQNIKNLTLETMGKALVASFTKAGLIAGGKVVAANTGKSFLINMAKAATSDPDWLMKNDALTEQEKVGANAGLNLLKDIVGNILGGR